MPLSHSPLRQTVPLATGDEDRPPLMPRSAPVLTKRVFFCGVVVENPTGTFPEDVQDLLTSLGEQLDCEDDSPLLSTEGSSTDPSPSDPLYARRRDSTDSSALADAINEFVDTERSYVKKLQTLKHDYADPLRTFSRHKDTAIIPSYEAKTLFGNIDQLLLVNQAFFNDLERMVAPDGPETVGGIGDVALKHFKQLRGFESYRQYYAKREEAQTIFEKEIRKGSGFAAFIDRIKYSSTETTNRIGLRELLMEPVQRIPRYTLMFRNMFRQMSPEDPQRLKLLEADEIASKIAQAETDSQTRQATIMFCLNVTVDEFPAWLFSFSRTFIDCIDVEDVLVESYGATGTEANLHCSLFLFDDKVMIVKRPEGKSAWALSGLDKLDKWTKGGSATGLKKAALVCKGVVDVTDIIATDIGGSDMHIFLEDPPQDQSGRWSGRPFRSLKVINPPPSANPDSSASNAKSRFLENLWLTQARYRTRFGRSVCVYKPEMQVQSRHGRTTVARTYFNLYQRSHFFLEPKKTKIIIHVVQEKYLDQAYTATLFGKGAPPFIIVRLMPIPGELTRYQVFDSNEPHEEIIVRTDCVADHIVETIHQLGLYKFKTGHISAPSTPTASVRSRGTIFSLDTISRNIFNALPGSSKGGDVFGGGTVNGHRRSKTGTSRSTASSYSASSGDSMFRTRSNSTVTSTGTSFSTGEEDEGSTSSKSSRPRSLSKAKKLVKRSKSPGALSEPDEPPSVQSTSSRRSGALSDSGHSSKRTGSESGGWESESDYGVENKGRYLDRFEDADTALELDDSEKDLAAKLELARRNSKNQHATVVPMDLQIPGEQTIHEEFSPSLARPSSRLSRDLPDLPNDEESRRSTIRPDKLSSIDSRTPSRAGSVNAHRISARPPTRQSVDEHRPMGPRSPSPLPPSSPRLHRPRLESESAVTSDKSPETSPNTPRRTRAMSMDEQIAQPKPRRPFGPAAKSNMVNINSDSTPKADVYTKRSASRAETTEPIEPLSIRKKALEALASKSGDESPTRNLKHRASEIPRTQPLHKVLPPKTTDSKETAVSDSPGKSPPIPMSPEHAEKVQNVEYLIELALSTKQDIESARRAVKRIRLEGNHSQSSLPGSPPSHDERVGSPVKSLRTLSRAPLTKEAQERMEEMHKLISKRSVGASPRARLLSLGSESPVSKLCELPRADDLNHSTEEVVSEVEKGLDNALKKQEHIITEMTQLADHLKEISTELKLAKLQSGNGKLQSQFLKHLLFNTSEENTALYQTFEEELFEMFGAINHLPPDDSWAVLTKDLRDTKAARYALAKDNSQLGRKVAELELQTEQYSAALRAYGLAL